MDRPITAVRRWALGLGAVALAGVIIVGAASRGPGQAEAQGALGVTIPETAREFLTQAELVEAVCATTRWRTLEIFAVIDALNETQPAAEAALAAAGINYALPDPEAYRGQATAALGTVCSAATVDEAVAAVDALLAINVDMEARYGALSEALGGQIEERVDEIEARIRPQLDAWAAERKAEVEAELQPEGQAIADQYLKEEQSRAQAELQAYAQSAAAGGGDAASIQAAIEAQVAVLQAQATEVITARVQEALAGRIAAAEARIRAEAEVMAQELAGKDAEALRGLQAPFDAMLARVDAAVAEARTADSPERRAVIEVRVRLAMKSVDGRLATARPLVEAARAELAARKAADPAFPDADEILALMTSRRDALEAELRAAMERGDETAFAVAGTTFQNFWAEIADDVNETTGTWTAARVCAQAQGSINSAIPDVEASIATFKDAAASVTGTGDDGARLRDTLGDAQSRLEGYLGSLRDAASQCQGAGDGEARDLIASLDALRREQVEVRLAVESAAAIARDLSEGN